MRRTELKRKRDKPRRKGKPVKSGIRRGPERYHQKHRDWIVTLPCHVCGSCINVLPCHLRWHTDGAEGLKPMDAWIWPGCDTCHTRQHAIGEPAFWHGFNPWEICWSYAIQSPIDAIRDYAETRMDYRLAA